MACHKIQLVRGFSLVEVIIVAGIITLFFGELLGGIHYTLALISNSRARLTALSIANNEIELIHSLTYDAVGTVAGIPAGAIPQVSTSTLNGINFSTRVLITYIDSSADGVGAADSNSITTDYKDVKVTVSWNQSGATSSVILIGTIVPRSIETSVGGGTLRVRVFDAAVVPLPGASVRVVNNSLTPKIDVTRTTDAMGEALFGGAPAGSDYQIFVFGTGYSSDQTYEATTSLPNPTTRPVAVLEADISTMSFFIDKVSTLAITTDANKTSQTLTENFDNAGGMATSTEIEIASSTVILSGGPSAYSPSGAVFLSVYAPTPLSAWGSFGLTDTLPTDTAVVAKFYSGTSTTALVPDSDLPGNSFGFSSFPVDVSSIDASLYPALTVGLTLTSASSTVTPSIDMAVMEYIESETPLASVLLELQGYKTIGTNASSAPIYKTTLSGTTNGSGQLNLSQVEFDSYLISAVGHDIIEACPANPVAISPNTSNSVSLIVGADTANSFRVVINTAAGVPLSGATVTLSRPGYSRVATTSTCGQVYFGNLDSAGDYSLDIQAPGYTSQTFSPMSISGDQVQTVSL